SMPYQVELRIKGGLPAVVLTTDDRARAMRLIEAARQRGTSAIAIDTARVVPSHEMIALRRFRLEPEAIVLEEPLAGRLPYEDVLAFVRAVIPVEHATDREQVLYVFRKSGETPWILRQSTTAHVVV